MVVSQILVEHGHFLRKLLIADKQAQKSSVPPKFEAICHILVEHGHIHFSMEHGRFSNFLMEHGRFSNFCGAWSFLKFWWNTVIFTFFGGAWSFLKFFGTSHIIITSD